MDYKKFIKIIDAIVQAKIKKILESAKFKSIIREQLKSELHNLLLEINSDENNKKSIKNVVRFDKEKKYPKLEKKFSNNEIINSILLDTINSNNNYFGDNSLFEISQDSNNSMINNLSRPISKIQVDPVAIQSEAMLLAQNELLRRGIDPSKVEMLNEDSVKDFKDSFAGEYIDDAHTDSGYYANNNQTAPNIDLNFLNKDYSKLLKLADEKSKIYRNKQ